MKTFNEYINEVETRADIGKNEHLGHKYDLNRNPESLLRNTGGRIKHISTMKNGAKVYHEKLSSDEHAYHVTHPKTGKTTIRLNTVKSGKAHQIQTVAATKDNPTKVHHFYHHLLHHHKYILTTNAQSHGGHKVWQKLSKMKGVNTHGWYQGKAVNTDKHLKDSDSHASISDLKHAGNKKEAQHAKSTMKMKLVAHAKHKQHTR